MMFEQPEPQGGELWLAGGIAFACLLLALACAAGIFNLARHLYGLPSLAAVRAERAAVALWPGVPGTLYRVTLRKQRSGRGQSVQYQLEANYRYEVNGRTYTGERLAHERSARHAYGAASSEEFRLIVAGLVPMLDYRRFRDAPQCEALESYGRCSASFEVNERVTVYHDPADPASALLERHDLVPVTVLEHYGVPLAWLVVLVFFLGALASSAWRLALWILGRLVPPARHEEQRPLLIRWARALGVLFLACGLSFYDVNMGWRGALNDSEEGLAWLAGAPLLVLLGGTGVYLLFKRRIDRKMGWDGRRRRKSGRSFWRSGGR